MQILTAIGLNAAIATATTSTEALNPSGEGGYSVQRDKTTAKTLS
ncbi:hypothetical protein [Hyphomicrobium sp.]|jgi:hypothetical protein